MKRFAFSLIKKTCLLATLIAVALTGCQPLEDEHFVPDGLVEDAEKAAVIRYGAQKTLKGQYIVIFKEGALTHPELLAGVDEGTSSTARMEAKEESYSRRTEIMHEESALILKENGIAGNRLRRVYSGEIKGMTVTLDDTRLEKLRSDPRIALIEEDRKIELQVRPLIKTPFIPSSGNKTVLPLTKTPFIPSGEGDDMRTVVGSSHATTLPQLTSWSIVKLGGSFKIPARGRFARRRVWVVDSGIDMDHEDLSIDARKSKNFTSEPSVDDGFGHGTHVAGIIGAIDNNKGVKGMAAGVKLVAIKVLDNQGVGAVSELIAGLNYIAWVAKKDDVVNISVGVPPSPAVDNAVQQIANKGIDVVIAAGNESQDAMNVSPARLNTPHVYTVCATNQADSLTWFSNYGSPVDYAAPGEGIYSTYLNDTYGYMGGTSMAAPHVAGLLVFKNAGNFTTVGYCQGMPGGQQVPIPGH